MKPLMERTLLDDLKDFATFLKSNACVWGSRIDNGKTKSLLITDTEQQILKEITDWAKEHNIGTVYLIDEEFVKTALLNEIERRNKEC